MPSVPSDDLAAVVSGIFKFRGTPGPIARRVARSLVEANLCGHDSHGVMRVPRYLDYMEQGRVVPAAVPVVRRQSGATALVDGAWGFGQIGARFACRMAMELASIQGMATVALHHVMHVGRLGEYADWLARHGCAALVLVSNGGPANATAPFGGRDRIFGTNPMAFAVPGGTGGRILMVDFATSATAEGKLAMARSRGERVAPGLVVDREGNPTEDPAAYYEGGALLPFGAHKGYGLMTMIEVMARFMTGYLAESAPGFRRGPGNATLIMAWEIERFVDRRIFAREMTAFVRAVSASRPAIGCDEVLLPGEPEARMRARRLREGVPLSDAEWERLQDLAGRRRSTSPAMA